MKALVVGSLRSDASEVENLKRYATYFGGLAPEGWTFSYAMIDDLVFDISPQAYKIFDANNATDLSGYQLIILRGKLRDHLDAAFAICEYAKLNGIRYLNDYTHVRSISKLAQAVNFYLIKAPFVRTVYTSRQNLLGLIKDGELEYPFIYKSRLGAHGDNNYLIHGQSDLEKIDSFGMIAQPFIRNDGDYRVVVVGEQELVIKRIAQSGSHLNNTSKGGDSVLIDEPDKRIVTEAHRVAKKSGMEIAGVDIIVDAQTNDFYLLEVNSQPQLMSGAFLDEKADLIKKYLAGLN